MMMRRISYFILGFVWLGNLLFVSQALAENKPFSIGIRIGLFTPLDAQIKGFRIVYFESTGAQESVMVSGFGTGPDVNLHFNYDFSNWGLMLAGGFRLLQENKIDLNHIYGRDMFENRLNIFPITLSSVYKIKIPDSRTIPYLGLGLGIYFAEWETKHWTWRDEVLTRYWLKGSAKPLGIHFLTGFNAFIYHDVFLNCEFRYSLIEGDWKIKDVDRNTQTEYQRLNIGGASINLGLGYSF